MGATLFAVIYTILFLKLLDIVLENLAILTSFFLSSDRRLADHFGGKLHLGYMQIREKLAELQVKIRYLLEDFLYCVAVYVLLLEV